MAFSEFKQKLGAFNTSHFQYVEKQKTLRDSTMWNDATAGGDDNKQIYAVLPPVEYFMNLPSNIKKQHLFQSITCADCFIGEVSAIQANGLILRILCMEDELARDLDHTNVAVVPLKCLPSFEGRGDPLAAFQLQDRVRAVIVDIDAPTHRIWASMNSVSLRSHQLDVKLGLINDDELPLHYREMININNKSYEECLKDSPQFNNKGGTDRLCAKLGIDGFAPLSLMHAINKLEILPHQFAEEMRKKQTYKLALKHVAKGVGYFREKKHTEAMQCFNYALSVDKNHVEGLVARGALYATLSSFKKAMEDLELALEVEPSHKDATNYLAQVLVVYGRQRMDGESLDASEAYFQRALKLNPWMEEAKDAMIELRARKLEKLKPKVLKSEAGRKGSDLPNSEMKRAHDTLLEIMRSDQESSKPPDPKSMWEEDEKAAGRAGQSSLLKPPFSQSAPIHEAVPQKDSNERQQSPMSRREAVMNREPGLSPMSRRESVSNREPELSHLSRREPASNREYDRSPPTSRRKLDRSSLSRHEYDRSPLSRHEYDQPPISRRKLDRSPMSRHKYDRSPISRRKLDRSPRSRREYDRSPMSRRRYDYSPMSRREYDRSPISRRRQDQSPMHRRDDKPSSYQEHVRSHYEEDYTKPHDSFQPSLPGQERQRSPVPRDPYQPMPDQENARYSQHESTLPPQKLASMSTYSNQTRSPYLPGALSRSPSRHEIPEPSVPLKAEQKIKESAYDPANPSDTNFFIYAEQDGLFQAMKGNKALTSDDMDDRFLIVKNSFSVTKPAPPKPPQGPRFMTPSSPDPLPAPPPPPPSLVIGQPAFGQPSNEHPTTVAPPTVGQTSFTWLRTKAKPGTATALVKPKSAVEAAKSPVESVPSTSNPFVASIDAAAAEPSAPRTARSHPFMRRAKATTTPDKSVEDSKGLVVEVNASEDGEHRRIIKHRSPDGRRYRRRSNSRSVSRNRSRSPMGADFLPTGISGDDEHAKMVHDFLSKLSARDKEEAKVRERVSGMRDRSEDRSSHGGMDGSLSRERSLASRLGRDSPYSSRRRGSPRDDRSRRRGSPSDDWSRRRGSPRDDSSRRRGSPSDDRLRRRGSPSDDRLRRRGCPSDDRLRRRGSPNDDRWRRRGSPSDDRSWRRDWHREDWPKERPRDRDISPWNHLFVDKQKEGHSKGKKEDESGDKQMSDKIKVGPGKGKAREELASKVDLLKKKVSNGEQSKNKGQKGAAKELSKSGHSDAKEDSSKSGKEEAVEQDNTRKGFEAGDEGGSSESASFSGRGSWRGNWRGDWRGRGRGEWRGRGRGIVDWRGRGRGMDEWRGRGRGMEEWRGRGRGTEEWRGRGRGTEEWRGRSRGTDEWRGRSRGIEEWSGRGRGTEEWRGRGRGTEEWRGRGRGRGFIREYWRGNTSLNSLSEWRHQEETYDYESRPETRDFQDDEYQEFRKRRRERESMYKDKSHSVDDEADDVDPEADGAKPDGKRKLFLPSAIDVRNVTTGAPVPSPPRPLDWSPKRWASVQKKIRAIEARKLRRSPWNSPERVPQEKECMITRGAHPKSGGPKYPLSFASRSLSDSQTPPHRIRTSDPAEPESPKNFTTSVEVKEPSTLTSGETQLKETGAATSKGKVAVKKGPTPSLAQMESFMKKLKAKTKPS